MIARSIVAGLLHGLCPETCFRCGLESQQAFCASCLSDFQRIQDPCPDCALPRPCAPCPASGKTWILDRVLAPFVYAAPLKRNLLRLKFSGYRMLGAALGAVLAAELESQALDYDALLPVPLHRQRLIARRFNQADEIARPISARYGIPLMTRRVARRGDPGPVSRLRRAERFLNLEGAFAIRRDLTGLRIAIVDDVITTGATVNSLAAALRAAGADRVGAIAVCRTTGIDALRIRQQ